MSYNISNRSYYEEEINNKDFGLCSYCDKPQTYDDWCQHCNSKRFQQNFDKWTSENKHIDKFIQEAQSRARNNDEVLEWIPYYRLSNIQYLAQGGFSTIYKSIWLDGYIIKWNNDKQEWERYILKSLNNSSNIHEDFLNEWKVHLKFLYSAINNYTNFVKIFGITQDPKTLNYMIVLQEMKLGSLRSNLLIKKYNPNDKYQNLYEIASSLSALHKCNLVHGDLHSGNLLFYEHNICYISDFGLSRPAYQSINSNESYGVLPYIAPEVLRGKPYTKAADIYSFGIVMWEFTSGVTAFSNVPHDLNLALEICKGHRPEIIEGTDPDYVKLMKRCWDIDANIRPSAEALAEIFDVLSTKHLIDINQEKRKPVPPVPPEHTDVVKPHPLSCFTSRKIDYSIKLNEILNQEELSSKIIINEDEEQLLSESLDDCKISSSNLDTDTTQE